MMPKLTLIGVADPLLARVFSIDDNLPFAGMVSLAAKRAVDANVFPGACDFEIGAASTCSIFHRVLSLKGVI